VRRRNLNSKNGLQKKQKKKTKTIGQLKEGLFWLTQNVFTMKFTKDKRDKDGGTS
jgi:hypothetical protein